MTDRELRHLNKEDLIDIIFEMKKKEAALLERIAGLETELEVRALKISKAGSIAEAALSVNGVLEAAQRAADDYLAEIVSTYGATKELCERMVRDTEHRCREREQETDRLIEAKWDTFMEKGKDMIQTGQSLIEMLK